jgi:hypothetical protein
MEGNSNPLRCRRPTHGLVPRYIICCYYISIRFEDLIARRLNKFLGTIASQEMLTTRSDRISEPWRMRTMCIN